jgi:hypothetical protein
MTITVKQNDDGTEWTIRNESTRDCVCIFKDDDGWEVLGYKRDSGIPYDYYLEPIEWFSDFAEALQCAHMAVDDAI